MAPTNAQPGPEVAQESEPEKLSNDNGTPDNSPSEHGSIRNARGDHTHRRLKNRHIQLIGTSGGFSALLCLRHQLNDVQGLAAPLALPCM
jgi:amino acid permease